MVCIQIPSIQTKIVHYINNKFNLLNGYEIKIEKIAIKWFDSIEANEVSIIDSDGNKMFLIESLYIDYNLTGILNNSNKKIDQVTINNSSIFITYLERETRTLNINDFIKQIKNKTKRDGFSPPLISINNFNISNSTFTYKNQFKDSLLDKFDHNHFEIKKLNGKFENIVSTNDTITMDILRLNGQEKKTHLKIEDMKSGFFYSKTQMYFNKLALKVGESLIKDSVHFEYETPKDFDDFINKVKVSGHLRNAVIFTKDLKYFAPAIGTINKVYSISCKMDGYINDFRFSNINMSLGNKSVLKGTVRMIGLPKIEETFLDIYLKNSLLNMADLKPYLGSKSYERLRVFKNIDVSASFLGYPNDFVATGIFNTKFGTINTDINIKIENDLDEALYNGNLDMNEFDLNGYLDNDYFDKITMSGIVTGTGITANSADLFFNGDISNVGINGYNYSSIEVNGRFTNQFFEGELFVSDPNFGINLLGTLDLREANHFFNLNLTMDNANLQPLNLSDNPLKLKSELKVNASGSNINDFTGSVNFKNIYLSNIKDSLLIKSLSVNSRIDNKEERKISIKSDLFKGDFLGGFKSNDLYKGIILLSKEILLKFKNNSDEINTYYENKLNDVLAFDMRYDINLIDINPILKIYQPDLFISPNTLLKGRLYSNLTSIFSLNSKVDSVRFKNYSFSHTDIQLNFSKISTSNDVLAMVYLNSKNQSIYDVKSENLMIDAIWDNNMVDFEFDLKQVNYDNLSKIKGKLNFGEESVTLKIDSSNLVILNEPWTLDKNNLVHLTDKSIEVENFNLKNHIQQLKINGKLSNQEKDVLKIIYQNIDIDVLNSLRNENFEGILSGYSNISMKNQNVVIENNIGIDSLGIRDYYFGNLRSQNNWDNLKKNFELSCQLEQMNEKTIDINGTYSPFIENQLNLKIEISELDLDVLELIFGKYVDEMSGNANGNFTVTGTIPNPIIKGKGTIKDASIIIKYLNTLYQYQGNFFFSEHEIGFENFLIHDIYKNTATLNGLIEHDNFKSMKLDMTATTDEFQILNTTFSDNDLYYGNGIISGVIKFEGPLKNVRIIGDIKTKKGTKLFIPIGGSENIENQEYISFVDLNSPKSTINVINKIDLKGINLDIDIDITNDAYCEIIFDIVSGDIVRGRGNGNIKLEIDSKGDFNMYGDFNIEQGNYNFTLYNLINKEFVILPDSKLSWFGNPYEGIMDIKGTYELLASLLPIINYNSSTFGLNDVTELGRDYPVKVLLDINGSLLSPNVSFDIMSENLPRNVVLPDGNVIDLEFELLKFLNQIDEQELKRQVFNLIVLRQFSTLESFNTGDVIKTSVSELLSNQLSYWINQVDENLEINIDLGKLDNEALNTFQLRLSYTFLDGRLRVTRDGGFTNQTNQANVASIAGDWTVEYILSDDGKYKLKMYNKTNYNPINTNQENQNTITTGFSFIHSQSFNEIKELFKKNK